MATYAVGDIQGCYDELQQLLATIHFDPRTDVLWCAGDVVNRGPRSLDVLRFLRNLGDHAVVVLGNHDLHLLRLAYGYTELSRPGDSLVSVLDAPDSAELINWLRTRPLMHYDVELNIAMLHGGLPPQWSIEEAQHHAQKVETLLQSDLYCDFFANLPGNKPDEWSRRINGWDSIRYITNSFTRLRYCDAEGKLYLKMKTPPDLSNTHEIALPWFVHPNRRSRNTLIIFGHWASLGFYQGHNVYGLDSGCVWGGQLTTIRLEDQRKFSVPCSGVCSIDAD